MDCPYPKCGAGADAETAGLQYEHFKSDLDDIKKNQGDIKNEVKEVNTTLMENLTKMVEAISNIRALEKRLDDFMKAAENAHNTFGADIREIDRTRPSRQELYWAISIAIGLTGVIVALITR